MADHKKKGLSSGLTHYGDPGFAAYLRRSFARSVCYSDAMLDRPVVGITWTASGFTNCPRGVPELLDRKRVVSGTSVSVRVDLGGRRILKLKTSVTYYRTAFSSHSLCSCT